MSIDGPMATGVQQANSRYPTKHSSSPQIQELDTCYHCSKASRTTLSTAEIHVTIAVRHSISAHWIVDEFERVLGSHTPNRKVQIDIHITDDAAPTTSEIQGRQRVRQKCMENPVPVVSGNGNIAVIYGKGRPDLKELVRETDGGCGCGYQSGGHELWPGEYGT